VFRLFTNLFFPGRKSTTPARRARLALESFEPRDLPSASTVPGPVQQTAHQGPAIGPAGNIPAQVSDLVFSGGFHQQGKVLTAALTGATGTAGTATFTPGARAGQNTLTVSVSGLADGATYTVDVNGTALSGTLTTNASGAGTLTLTDVATAITAGTTLTVLDSTSTTVLTGTFTPPGCPTPPALTATLTPPSGSATGASGRAIYLPGVSPGSNIFGLMASGLAATTTYTVDVGGTTVGTFTTNASGAGDLALTDLTQTVGANTTVTVLDPSGTTVLSGVLASFHLF
jgi:hypothetical protein